MLTKIQEIIDDFLKEQVYLRVVKDTDTNATKVVDQYGRSVSGIKEINTRTEYQSANEATVTFYEVDQKGNILASQGSK